MGRLSVFPIWTKYERPFMNVFCTYIFGPCVYWDPISLPTIKGMFCFKWKLKLSKTTEYQCHWSPTRKETFLCSAGLDLFLASSSLFKLTMTCYWLFHCLQATTSQNVLSHKFTLTELLQRSASVIIKRDSFFELQSEAKWLHIGATFITKWGNNYNFIK